MLKMTLSKALHLRNGLFLCLLVLILLPQSRKCSLSFALLCCKVQVNMLFTWRHDGPQTRIIFLVTEVDLIKWGRDDIRKPEICYWAVDSKTVTKACPTRKGWLSWWAVRANLIMPPWYSTVDIDNDSEVVVVIIKTVAWTDKAFDVDQLWTD